MPQYISMAVREDLVDEVTKFMAERLIARDETFSTSASGVLGEGLSTAESREWAVEEFQILKSNETGAKSITLFAQVLDILADAAPNPVPNQDVEKVTGVPFLTMQQSFGRATTWMKNHVDSDARWPIFWPGGGWAMTESNAARWKSIG